ncbi:MAG: hypothetical protein GY698_09385 [Actinomycetia bacterium]|nr:hypothetical protein [Actinomycetes bacterium]
MAVVAGDRVAVWVLLIERSVHQGAELSLHWRESAASLAARRYLEQAWSADHPLPTDLQEAIETYNQLSAVAEHVLLAPFSIEGHQFFDGDQDLRPRCEVCGQPVTLADVDDPQSWIHAGDANDWADHGAEVDSPDLLPMEGDIA